MNGWECCQKIFDPNPYFTVAGKNLFYLIRINQLLVSAISGLYYNCFTIATYDCNVQFMIVMTVASTLKLRLWLRLESARIENYDRNLCSKLKRNFQL